MTAETDIAAIDDGGANTAAEVRTALTSVLDRADRSVSFAEYDPAADGVTDDASKLRTALSDINTAGGGWLYIPPGDYLFDSVDGANIYVANVPANTRISGAGTGVTNLKLGGSLADSAQLFNVINDNVEISHMTLDGNKARTATTFDIDATPLNAGDDVTVPENLRFHDLYIHDSLGEGIDVDAARLVHIWACVVVDCAGNAIQLSTGSTSPFVEASSVSDCYISNCATDRTSNAGALALRSGSTTVTNIRVENCGFPLIVEPAANDVVQITNCFFHSDATETTANSLTGHANGGEVIFNGCVFYDDGSTRTLQGGANGLKVQVIGCLFKDVSGTDALLHHIGTDDGSPWLIEGTSFVGGQRGMQTGNAVGVDVRVIGCYFTGQTSLSIWLRGDSCFVSNCEADSEFDIDGNTNIVMGNVVSLISDAGTGNIIKNNVIGGTFTADGT